MKEPLLNRKSEVELKNDVLRLVLYKTKSISLCCCKKICSIKIPKGNYQYAFNLEKIIRLTCLFAFVSEVIFTAIDFAVTIAEASPNKDGTYSEIDTFNFLDVI